MFSAVDRFVRKHPDSALQVLFVAYGDPRRRSHPTFEALKNVLTSGSYADATPVVGQRPTDLDRWVEGMKNDLTLGTNPDDPLDEPARRRPGQSFPVSHDPVDAKPVDAKPVDAKPAGAKSADSASEAEAPAEPNITPPRPR